ncbi:tyrosine-type recombinase/integrase [Pseudomonas putida]|uniref:tyrosine-type recombinase/integrase n=1 Tax=Pseudomonas putida TaxID=303 RepID=UPI00274DFC9F|nr:site-specific integrase [Pseudomonas putida]MDP9523600.1 site-specific integrase [Pseudomonas putida]
MRVERATQVDTGRNKVTSYVILQNGPLENDSIVLIPSLYLAHLSRKFCPDRTQNAIAHDLKKYFSALQDAERSWDEITDDQMSAYIENTLIAELDLQKKSVQRNCASLKGLYSYAYDQGLTSTYPNYSFTYYDKNFNLEQGQGSTKLNFHLTQKHINDSIFEILLSHCPGESAFIRERNEIIMLLGHDAGLRCFECSHPENLRLSQLAPKMREIENTKKLNITLTILGKRNKIRHIDINPKLTQKIKHFLKSSRSKVQGDLLISDLNGNALSESFASRLFEKAKSAALPSIKKEILRLAQLDDAPYTLSYSNAKKLTFHCLRHTFATNLVTFCYINNIDPKAYLPLQLGHDDYETTKQYINFEASIHNRNLLRKSFSKS